MHLMTEPSTEYNELVDEYKGLHQDPTMFPGKSVLKYTHYIRSILKDNKCKTLLDYGSGKGYLYEADHPYTKKKLTKPLNKFWNLNSVTCYDPGVEKFSKLPEGVFDAVIAVDVMEHVPTEDAEWVLDKIMGYSSKAVFLNIACYEALKTFKNGKNVHVSVHSPEWWMDLLRKVWYTKHHEWTTVHVTFEEVEERFVSSGIFKTNVLYSH